jgi:hypothetical protein
VTDVATGDMRNGTSHNEGRAQKLCSSPRLLGAVLLLLRTRTAGTQAAATAGVGRVGCVNSVGRADPADLRGKSSCEPHARDTRLITECTAPRTRRRALYFRPSLTRLTNLS